MVAAGIFGSSIEKYLRNNKPRSTSSGTGSVKLETKSENGEMEEPPAKKKRIDHPQYPKSPAAPVIPAGEDQASHRRHLKILQLEENKVTPNKRTVADLMARTYPFRRQEILEQPQLLEQLLKTYPSLKRPEQVR